MTLPVTQISRLGRIVTGKTPSTKHPEFFGGRYPFITPTDIKNDLRIVETERFLSEQGEELLKNYLLPTGTVCFVCIGATIGKLCLTTQPSFTNQQINSIIVDEFNHDNKYVYYLLRYNVDSIKPRAGGAATPIINKTAFSAVQLPVHPLSAQRKIASILSAYDDLIENNLRRIQILEEMARLVYREWFVHFRFPGHESVRMVDSPLGKIPEGWEVSWLGGLAEEQRRAVDPALLEPEVPYVGLEHIPRRSVALREWGQANDAHSTKYEFRKGEILFGKIRPYFHKVAVVPMQGICSTDAIVISAKRRAWFPLILSCVASDDFIAYATQTSSGTKMPRANWSVLVEYPIALPPWSLLVRFNSFMETVLAELHNLTYRNRSLRTTRDLLLPRLISGQLDVSDWQTTAEALR